MSNSVQTRGELYNKYQKSNPELAEAFLGDRRVTYSSELCFGAILIIAAIGCTIMVTSIIAGVSNGFTQGHNFSLMFKIMGGVYGSAAALGLVFLAIGYCQRRNVLAEPLTEGQASEIIIQHSIPLQSIGEARVD